MTTDDNRSFIRRLFTRRLDEAEAGTNPASDAPAPKGEASTGGTLRRAAPGDATTAGAASTSAPTDAPTAATESTSASPDTTTAGAPTGTSAEVATTEAASSSAAAEATATGAATGSASAEGTIAGAASAGTPAEATTGGAATTGTSAEATTAAGASVDAAGVDASIRGAAGVGALNDGAVAGTGSLGGAALSSEAGGVASLIPVPRAGADDALAAREPAVVATVADNGAAPKGAGDGSENVAGPDASGRSSAGASSEIDAASPETSGVSGRGAGQTPAPAEHDATPRPEAGSTGGATPARDATLPRGDSSTEGPLSLPRKPEISVAADGAADGAETPGVPDHTGHLSASGHDSASSLGGTSSQGGTSDPGSANSQGSTSSQGGTNSQGGTSDPGSANSQGSASRHGESGHGESDERDWSDGGLGHGAGGYVPSFLDSDFDESDDSRSGSAVTDQAAADEGLATAEQTIFGHPVSEHPAPDQSAGAAATEESPAAEGTAADTQASARPAPRRAEIGEWRGIVLITGTDTDVGKTIATAAVVAAAQASGLRVAVIKPGQTGIVTGAPTDIEVVSRLAAPETARALAEYPEPLAPLAAANIAEMAPLELYEVVDAIRAEADKHDLVLVEGAGGLLVPMGVRPSGEAWTLADLATTLGVGALVVARAGLGTLNHTALTLEALSRRGVPAGVIIGAWPADPQLVHWANLSELLPHLVGALPEGAGRMDPGVFRRSAPGWLTPALYGVLDNWRVWAEEIG